MVREGEVTKPFDVLKKDAVIASHRLLEASAGTGKTFSIENLAARLLIEGEEPLKIENILTVTFTKAATLDLKKRIRSNLEKVIDALEASNPGPWEYLEPFIGDPEAALLARRRLERALIAYDDAQIFTIHGFCARMLKEYGFEVNVNLDFTDADNELVKERMRQAVRDYFRTEMTEDAVGKSQRRWVFKRSECQEEKLEKDLFAILQIGGEIDPVPSFQELYEQFCRKIAELKAKGWTAAGLQSDVEALIPFYNGIKDKLGQFKHGYDVMISTFLAVFESEVPTKEHFHGLIGAGSIFSTMFSPDQINKKNKKPLPFAELCIPGCIETTITEIEPLVSRHHGMARMAYDCRRLMRRQLDEEEMRGFDDLLTGMRKSLASQSFVNLVRGRYRAVIVDEFQDTDPHQWEIFKTLFPPKGADWGHLYLVGDPKQSIYAFRQADIYTYLQAADLIGKEHQASLDTNFRSTPALVSALNSLFSEPFPKGWIALPRLNRILEVPKVKWGDKVKDISFKDERGAVHFHLHETEKYDAKTSESEAFLPFMAQEILRLHREEGFALKEFAILITDKHQSERVSHYLKGCGIPCFQQRVEPVSQSPTVDSLRELLDAILNYRDESIVKKALGGTFIGWTHIQIAQLKEDTVFAEVQSKLRHLETVWREGGLAVCMDDLMQSVWHGDGRSVLEILLTRKNGGQMYADYEHLMELLLEEDLTPQETIVFLDRFKQTESADEERLKRRSDLGEDAVQVMTLFASKGLEFGVVFTLGLCSRPKKDELYYSLEGKIRFITSKDDPDLQRYFKEKDAEKMRQLYVAMTRAKYRLYAPVVLASKETQGQEGILAPMELFVQQFDCDFIEFLEASARSESLSYTFHSSDQIAITPLHEKTDAVLVEPKKVDVPGTSVCIHSFSSLSRKKTGEKLDGDPPHDFDCAERTPFTLPTGSETGTLLHTLLEKIPFSLGKQWQSPDDVLPLVRPFTDGTPYWDWSPVLAEMVFQAVKTPLPGCSPLEDILPAHCGYEEEFFYPRGSDTYLKGFIDLLFFHEGKYYLLDWKSNWLGASSKQYGEAEVHEAMLNNDYYRQAEIYTEALKKYLSLVDPRPFETLFGGVYYVFLRGLPEHGIIYSYPPFPYS
jgi:exodeoxyribonuclease V beta subunit